MQEALFQQEAILQQTREEKDQLAQMLNQANNTVLRQKEKIKVQEKMSKKYNELLLENKRKHQMLLDKTKELEITKGQVKEIGELKERLNKINLTNRELVTRKCALESAVASKDKQMQELRDTI